MPVNKPRKMYGFLRAAVIVKFEYCLGVNTSACLRKLYCSYVNSILIGDHKLLSTTTNNNLVCESCT